jgi:hypothetical protein
MKHYIFIDGMLKGTMLRAEMEPNNPKIREVSADDYEYHQITKKWYDKNIISKETYDRCTEEMINKYKDIPLTEAQKSYVSSLECEK